MENLVFLTRHDYVFYSMMRLSGVESRSKFAEAFEVVKIILGNEGYD